MDYPCSGTKAGARSLSTVGNMTDVIEDSTQYLHKDDLNAIALYLKTLPPQAKSKFINRTRQPLTGKLAAMITGQVELPGAGLFQSFSAKCHKITRSDEPGKYPKLAGNSIVLSENATSLIRLLLEGSKTAETKKRGGRKRRRCPVLRKNFLTGRSPRCLASSANSRGNLASPVTTREVSSLRQALQKKP